MTLGLRVCSLGSDETTRNGKENHHRGSDQIKINHSLVWEENLTVRASERRPNVNFRRNEILHINKMSLVQFTLVFLCWWKRNNWIQSRRWVFVQWCCCFSSVLQHWIQNETMTKRFKSCFLLWGWMNLYNPTGFGCFRWNVKRRFDDGVKYHFLNGSLVLAQQSAGFICST